MNQVTEAALRGPRGGGRRLAEGARLPGFRSLALSCLLLLTTGPAWGATTGVVNINTASAVELQLLPGIGARRAAAIVEARRASGGFAQAEDLIEVDGIGAVMLERMRVHVALEGETTARRVNVRSPATESER